MIHHILIESRYNATVRDASKGSTTIGFFGASAQNGRGVGSFPWPILNSLGQLSQPVGRVHLLHRIQYIIYIINHKRKSGLVRTAKFTQFTGNCESNCGRKTCRGSRCWREPHHSMAVYCNSRASYTDGYLQRAHSYVSERGERLLFLRRHRFSRHGILRQDCGSNEIGGTV